MQLDRSELLKAIKFLKPAISKADQSEQNVSDQIKALTHVRVKIEDDVCTMTASDGYCGKRVILNKPPQLLLEGEPEKPENIQCLIPRATLEAFETLCQKHKSKFEKLSKIDHSLKMVDIYPDALESHKDRLEYSQPVGIHFPDLDQLFFASGAPVQDIKVNPLIVIDALKEFHGSVEITFSGANRPVHIKTEDLTFQAFFLPVKGVEDD